MKKFKINSIACFCTVFLFFFSLSAFAETVDIMELKKLLELGKRYCEISRFEKAIKKYKKAFEKFNSADGAYNLGITYEIDLRDREKALYYYGRFLELENKSIDADNVKRWIIEIKLELKREKIKRASKKKKYKERKILDETDENNENLQYSEDDVLKPKKESPDLRKVKMLKKLANKEVLKKNYEKGVQIYLKVLEMSSDPDAAYNLGFVFDHYLRNYEEAGYYYRKFLELEPFSGDAEQVKKWLKRVESQM